MGNLIQRISRAGLITALIGAALLWFSLGDTVVSFKSAKSFDELLNGGARAGDHVSGQVPYLLDSFASMETWSKSRDGKSRTPAKTSAVYYVYPGGDRFLGVRIGSSNLSAASSLADETYDYLAGGAKPTAELALDCRISVMEEELAELFFDELRDYYDYSDQDLEDMGAPLMLEPRAFGTIRIFCAVGAVLFLAGVFLLVRRWKKMGALVRADRTAREEKNRRASYDPELD